MSSGGGGGTTTSTTRTTLPGWEGPYAQQYLGGVAGQVFPGGQLAGEPAGLNQNVAPFTPNQNQALQLGAGQTGAAQGLANLGANTVGQYASGQYLNPSTNPSLGQYYNQAATNLTNQYATATAPSTMAAFQQAGAFDSSGYGQQVQQNAYGLGQGLATLGANIYEPAYQQQSAQQLQAATQQQQQQNVNNANTANAAQAANWPYSILSQLGGALGLASGGGGFTSSTGPAPGGGK
jgi:hypothetical protein